ncbi:MAG: hypothetical protein DWQ02_22865 [Bacteroidetes bacterium]|nr:MAG: hypothetical protein DWQ02_22865 [Bacteroidota bacterium]
MKKLLRLVFPILLLIIGIQFTRDYFGTSETKTREDLQLLVTSGERTMAILNNEYKEKTIKIAKIPIKTYEVNYTFMVRGKQYKGKKTLDSPPTSLEAEVTYLSIDPTINAIDPAEELSEFIESEGNIGYLITGMILFLVGLALLYFRLRPLLNLKKQSEPERELPTAKPSIKVQNDKISKIKQQKKEKASQADSVTKKESTPDENPRFSSPETRAFINEMKKNRDIKRDFTESDHSNYMPAPRNDNPKEE